MNTPLDDKALRKAWLKKKFASWEYHEELLELHDEYLTTLHRHWARPDIQKQYPGDYKAMQSPVFFNFDRVQKPGEITKAEWNSKPTVGWADAISYNFNRGYDFAGCNEYAGIEDATRIRLNELVGLMLIHCTNIRITIDQRWDDADDEVLNEKYTGPITWPATWRAEVAPASAPTPGLRAAVGEPCPREGFWVTPAKTNSRRWFKAGELMPDVGGDYGATIWEWDSKA